MKKENPTNPTT